MNNEVLAYTAGILDGEGYLACYRPEGKWYKQKICVHMKKKDVPEWFLKTWGGQLNIDRRDNSWKWAIGVKGGKELLELCYPYFVEKKEQARLMLEMMKIKEENKPKKIGEPDSKEVKEKKEKIYLELRSHYKPCQKRNGLDLARMNSQKSYKK